MGRRAEASGNPMPDNAVIVQVKFGQDHMSGNAFIGHLRLLAALGSMGQNSAHKAERKPGNSGRLLGRIQTDSFSLLSRYF
jgi:hypothetical protein